MRVLLIDDEPAIHDSYRRCFASGTEETRAAQLREMAAELFGASDDAEEAPATADCFELTHADQGLAGLQNVALAIAEGKPFQVAFIDIRMPPGIDGKETARRIREIDQDINLVIVTGYSDHTALSIAKVAGPIDKIFYINKPFEPEEIVQTARALGHRWYADIELKNAKAELAQKVEFLEKQSIELAANEARANHVANHDSLTGSPNRLAFLRVLNETLLQGTSSISVGLVDLDRFKNVNDTLGHFAGDELIRQVCHKLTRIVGAKGVVARLGGDEFAICIPCVTSEVAQVVCRELIEACSEEFAIFDHEVKVGASMGLVHRAAGVCKDPIDLLRLADIALYDAKRGGGSQVRMFDASMDESVRFRQGIEHGLRKAIANDELTMMFQPIVDRDNRHVSGFEALIRWTKSDGAPVSPAVFIPVAEESSLIHDIGEWVTERAMLACKSLPEQYLSINFSPRQFRRAEFSDRLISRARYHDINPSQIQIEITETAIFDDHEHAALTLDTLRSAGFLIALDDFGTGYSSLFNIRNFALDCIKVDKSFVDSMGREHQSAAIINSVAHLARSLGLHVVAEGVETEIQYQALRLAGCSHMQGYLFGKPMTLTEAIAFAAGRDQPSISNAFHPNVAPIRAIARK
jgi:diguanylate cyclase (GGDEF)-like protein